MERRRSSGALALRLPGRSHGWKPPTFSRGSKAFKPCDNSANEKMRFSAGHTRERALKHASIHKQLPFITPHATSTWDAVVNSLSA
jgi:hypothetical protein